MSASLEGREPLLDHHLMEFAAQLPDAFKYNKGIKKRILKDIVHDYVPKELMDRPKKGFAIPIGNNEHFLSIISRFCVYTFFINGLCNSILVVSES